MRLLPLPRLLLLCLALSGCVAPTGKIPVPLPDRSAELAALLGDFNKGVRAPAWVAAVIQGDQIIAVAGVGVRDVTTGVPINVETDKFHWGSVTKSVTATMIAGVVDEGNLSWDTTLSALLSGMPMQEAYRGVTIASLMNHRADLPAYTRLGPAEAQRFSSYAGTPVEKRGAFVREVLQEPAPAPDDARLVYSNAGPVTAAHATEVATGRSWEDLVRIHVFERIGMKSAGFGMPLDAQHPDQPSGHMGQSPDGLTALGARQQPGSPMLDPAGNMHSTVRDFALYARAHLLGLKGRKGPLDSSAVRMLHTAPADGRTIGPDSEGYAMGWGLRRAAGQTVHWHNGSAGAFFAQADIFPADDLAIVIMANAGFAGRSAPELVRQIRNLYVQ